MQTAPKNISYAKPVIDKEFGRDFAAYKYANASNVREGEGAYGGERAFDNDPATYWTTNDNITAASLEIDLEEPTIINLVELSEAKGLQHVQSFRVEAMVDSDWKLLTEGTSIGERRLAHFSPLLAWKVRLRILKATASPAISKFALYRSGY